MKAFFEFIWYTILGIIMGAVPFYVLYIMGVL